jgi:hypothetical protein
MKKYSVEQLQKLLKMARDARDEVSAKDLCEQLFEATGVKEAEIAEFVPSGNPELDKLRKNLTAAILARDEECEAALREMIADIVKSEKVDETIPEVVVELTAEEPAEEIENPFEIPEVVEEPVIKESLTTESVDEGLEGVFSPLDSRFAPDEPLSIEASMKDVLSHTQIAALRKEGFLNEFQLKKLIKDWPGEEKIGLMRIKGVGPSTADAILEKLTNEA